MDNKESENHQAGPPLLIIAMGVSGCGKSTVGESIAELLDADYRDGDNLHTKSNVAKMARGEPLTDEDRAPWLALIRSTADQIAKAQEEAGKTRPIVVIACSALKRSYRDILRGNHPASDKPPSPSNIPTTHPLDHADIPSRQTLKTYFVWIDGPRAVILDRMSKRQGHYMKATMLDSQLATLERPSEEENDVIRVDLETPSTVQVQTALQRLKSLEGLSIKTGANL